jgi:hypothetical protein
MLAPSMALQSSRAGRFAVESMLTLLALAFLLLVAEGLFRLLVPADALPRAPASRGLDVHPELPRLVLEDLGRPGVRGVHADVVHENNRDGFRGPERPRTKPAGIPRIAIIGDSTAMGWGVPQPDTFAARLEDSLREKNTPGPPEVLNFGLAAMTAHGAVKRLVELGLDFDPDVVVYAFAVNDIQGPHYRSSLDRDYAASLFRHDSKSHLWRWLRPRWLAFRELVLTPEGTFAFELDDNYFHNPEAWGALKATLEGFAALAREHDFCPVIVLNTQMQSLNALHPYARHYEAVAAMARELGLATIEPLERFQMEDAENLWVHRGDRHANRRAHAIYAELIGDAIQGLPPHCLAP